MCSRCSEYELLLAVIGGLQGSKATLDVVWHARLSEDALHCFCIRTKLINVTQRVIERSILAVLQ